MDPTWPRHEAKRDPISPDVRYSFQASGVKKEERNALLVFINHDGGTQMRSVKMAVIAVMLTGLFATQANARRDHAVDGLIIGSAVGGVVGYIVGNEMDRDHYGRGHVYAQPVVYAPPPPPPPRYYESRVHYRQTYRPVEVCRETVIVRERHGRYRETVRTVCRDRGDWRDDGRRSHHSEPYSYDGY